MELRDIQASLRAGIASRSVPVGPFLVLVHAESDNPFRNYAVPVDGAAPSAADVASLVAFFRERRRLPRLEYVRPAPAVDASLGAAGFDIASTLTLMALDGGVAPVTADGYAVALVDDVDSLRRAAGVQDVAYGEVAGEPDPAGLVRTVEHGGQVALATHVASGAAVGAGLSTPPQGGLVEIAAVGVMPEHRRRGIGALVTSVLTDSALGRGHQPFLQVERDEPLRVYQRIGYRVIGEMADARRPSAS